MDSEEPDNGRREFLKCMAWAGTGALFSVAAGVPVSIGLDDALAAPPNLASFNFLQISDSHIGFAKPANPDARATFREAIAKVKALPRRPDFIIHTGDVSQLSRDEEFDDAHQMLLDTGVPLFFIPGEHDMLDPDGGKAFVNRFGKGTRGAGWYSFDHGGVHFVALVNVADLKPGGMGNLGPEQLAWLKADLAIVKAWKGDHEGNLIYRKTARNFNPNMATAAKVTIAEVEELVPNGSLDPDQIHTPGIFVSRILQGKDYAKRIEFHTTRPRPSPAATGEEV